MTAVIDRPTVPSPASGLVCRNCGAQFPLGAQHACLECWGPLEIGYDPDALARVTHEQIRSGPYSLWRYAGLLPVGQSADTRVDSHTGMTPLIRADRLAEELGFSAPVWVKDDSANPTHSFKDRVVSVAITAARELGFTRIACASTGNLANSVAAHAARIGMPSIVFVPADLEPAKITQTAIYGGTLVGIEGSYDDVNRLCSELGETDEFEDTGFVNVNVRPYYAEGSKTLGYEVAEQLGWRPAAAVRGADGVRLDAHQDPQGVRGARRRRSGPGVVLDGLRGPVRGLLAHRHRVRRRLRHRRPGQADRHREVAQYRQPGRRPLRTERRPLHRRGDGLGRRRRDP